MSLQPEYIEKWEKGKNADVIYALYHLLSYAFFVTRFEGYEKDEREGKIIFTIMHPIPIVANFALSSERPELIKSEVE